MKVCYMNTLVASGIAAALCAGNLPANGDWTPIELVSETPVLWLDASDGSSVDLDGDDVLQWGDKSGNDNHAAQDNSSMRPEYVTDQLAGKPVVRFSSGNRLDIDSVLAGGASGRTIFVVAQTEVNDTNQAILVLNSSAIAATPNLGNIYGVTPEIWVRVLGNQQFGESLPTDEFSLLAIGNSEGAKIDEIYGYLNGSDLNSVASTYGDTTLNVLGEDSSIGSSIGYYEQQKWAGDIAEVLVFDRALADVDRKIVEGYLAHKWGLEDNLPAEHPHKEYAPSVPLWVDEDFHDGSGDFGVTLFNSIQDAIDAARPGATIHVQPGTYTEDINVGNTSGLALMGAQSGVSAGVGAARDATTTGGETILVGTITTGSGTSGWPDGLTIDGFRLEDTSFVQSIRVQGDVVITNCIVHHTSTYFMISVGGNVGTEHTLTLTNSNINGPRGFSIGNARIDNALIENNVFNTTSASLVSASANDAVVTVHGNEFNSPRGLNLLTSGNTITDNVFNTPAGTNNRGMDLYEVEDNIITGNTFSDDALGIYIRSGGRLVDPDNNTIENNTFGADSFQNDLAWDLLYGANTLDSVNFLAVKVLASSGSVVGLNVHNTTQDTYHATIQAAIDASEDDDTIEVAAGTYQEDLDVQGRSGLTLLGPWVGVSAGPAGIRDDTSTDGEAIVIGQIQFGDDTPTVSDLTIDGFRLEDTGLVDNGARINGALAIRNTIAHSSTQYFLISVGTGSGHSLELTNSNITGERGFLIGNTSITEALIENNVFNTEHHSALSWNAEPGVAIVKDNEFNSARGLIVNQNGNHVIGNTFNVPDGSGTWGIQLRETKGNVITGNTFAGDGLGIDLFDGGLEAGEGHGANTISSNTLGTKSFFNNKGFDQVFGGNNIDGVEFYGVKVLMDSGVVEDFMVHNVTRNKFYMSIQAAVADANSGDVISVGIGDYVEDGQIVIDKDLTIVGADKEATIVRPADDTVNDGGDGRGWILVEAGSEFNLSNVTLDGDGKKIFQAIRSHGTGVIDNNIVKNMKFSTYFGYGVAAYGNMTISDNTFINIERVGVVVFDMSPFLGGPAMADDVWVTGNTYTGKGEGDHLDYGIEVSGGAKATLIGNTITGNKGEASDGSSSAAILITDWFAPGTEAAITGNTLTDSTIGIAVGYNAGDESVVTAQNNVISGNTEYGVLNLSDVMEVDARRNWWGDASGPYHETKNSEGEGDTVSDNVIFDPWFEYETVPDWMKPDFVVTDITLDPSSVEAGGTFDAEVTVLNKGDIPGHADALRVFLSEPDSAGAGVPGDAEKNAGLLFVDIPVTLTFTALAAPSETGWYRFRAFVNADHVTDEKSTGNNQKTLGYVVHEEMISWSPELRDAIDDLVLWLDASDTGTVGLDNGVVAQWADKSGEGNHATQADTGMRPAYTTNVVDGKPVVRFSLGDRLDIGSVLAGGTSGRTVFIVANTEENDKNQAIIVLNSSSTESTGNLYGVTPEIWVRVLGSQQFAGQLPTDEFSLLTIANAENAQIDQIYGYLNGDGLTPVASTHGSTVLNILGNDASIGSSIGYYEQQQWAGDVAEILVFDSELSGADRVTVEGYLAHKWGLKGNLPEDHAYKTDEPTFAVADWMKPDFVVDEVTLDPAPTGTGEDFSAHVTIRNKGDVPGDAGILRVFLSEIDFAGAGTLGVAERVAGELTVNQTRTLTFTGLTAPSETGTHHFRAFVNADHDTDEKNFGNNQKSVTYTMHAGGEDSEDPDSDEPASWEKPDFIVTEIVLDPVPSTTGQNFNAHVTVLNKGDIAGDAGELRVYLSEAGFVTSGTPYDAKKAAGNLNVDQERTLTFEIATSGDAGWHHFRAFVNATQSTDEKSFGNNQKSRVYRTYDIVLKINTSHPDGNELTWNSKWGRTYKVLRSENLLGGEFESIATGLQATPPENTYIDTSPPQSGSAIYTIRVE